MRVFVAKIIRLAAAVLGSYAVVAAQQQPAARVVPKPQPGAPATAPQKTNPGPLPPRPVGGLNVPVPDVAAELTASKTKNSEFANYVQQLSINGGECHFRMTTAAAAQKIVWQISGAPFEPLTNAAGWSAPAGIVASGTAQTFASPPSAYFTVNLAASLGPPTARARRLYVRALAVKSNNLLAARPSNAVVITYVASDAGGIIIKPSPGTFSTVPGVVADVSIVRYKPPVTHGDPYALILTKTPPSGELKMVLSKINATAPGTHFHLSPDEYEKIKKSFTFTEQVQNAGLAFLGALKSGYNWLDDKYNYAANKAAGLLAPVVGQANARKAIDYYTGLYGMSPSYGDFDESLDTGKAAFSAFVMDDANVPESKKGSVVSGTNAFVEDVRNLANGGGDPNRFYRQDPDYAERPAVVVLSVKYRGVNGVALDTRGGKKTFKVSIMSAPVVDKSTLMSGTKSGGQEHSPILLAEKSITLPNATPGTTFLLPVYVNYGPQYKSENQLWNMAYGMNDKAVITADNDSVKVVASTKYVKQ